MDEPGSADYPDNGIETPVDEPVIDESPGANPQINKFGVYVEGVERINIPFPKKAGKTEVAILLVHDQADGLWRSSYSMRAGTSGAFSPICDYDPGYESRELALDAAGGEVRALLLRESNRGGLSDNQRRQVKAAVQALNSWMAFTVNHRAAYPGIAAAAGDAQQLPLFAEQLPLFANQILAPEPDKDSETKVEIAPSRANAQELSTQEPKTEESEESSTPVALKGTVEDHQLPAAQISAEIESKSEEAPEQAKTETLGPTKTPTTVKQVDVENVRMNIEPHYHTKRLQYVYIVTLSARVARSKFDELNGAAKRMGGWYSPTFQGSPAGFAFKTEEIAQRFVSVNRHGDGSRDRSDSIPV